MSVTAPSRFPERGEYMWLREPHVKAGTPPKPVPLRSNDHAAKRGAASLSHATK